VTRKRLSGVVFILPVILSAGELVANAADRTNATRTASFVQLGRLRRVSEALPAAEASHCSQPVHPIARAVSFTEEPDVGNPQVRFCEGH